MKFELNLNSALIEINHSPAISDWIINLYNHVINFNRFD